MKIHEYQGKELFRKFGMVTPRGTPCFSVDEAVEAAKGLGGVFSEVRACVYFALQRADMTLAMPAHAVFLTEETVDRKAIKTEKQLLRRKRLLEVLPLFKGLSDTERAELARSMKYAPFAKGEVMTRRAAKTVKTAGIAWM